MSHPLITEFLEGLDLTRTADLVIAFHHLRHFPYPRSFTDAQWQQLWEPLAEYGPNIFGAPDHAGTAASVRLLISEAGGYRAKAEDPHIETPLAPRAWLAIFRHALSRGLIGAVAFGTAARFLLVQAGGNAAPGLPADGEAAMHVLRGDARQASRVGAMTPAERDTLAGLPETVTIWRGGFHGAGKISIERARSIFWALDRDTAETYIRGRRAMQSLVIVKAIQAGVRSLADPNPEIDEANAFLLRAVVPRQLILAYIEAGVASEAVEVWVDFEKLTADMVELVDCGSLLRMAA